LNLNCDFDRLLELLNNHNAIRQMLGHGFTDETISGRQFQDTHHANISISATFVQELTVRISGCPQSQCSIAATSLTGRIP